MSEWLDVDVSARPVETYRGGLRSTGLEEHPIRTSRRGACLQSGQQDASESATSNAFLDEHAPDLGWPPRHLRHARCPEAPTTHRYGLVVQIADEEGSMRRCELTCREGRIVRTPVDLDVELLGCQFQRCNIGVLVPHLLQSQLLRHLPSVGNRTQPLTPETPRQGE